MFYSNTQSMKYNKLVKRAHGNAVAHGFWNKDYSHRHALMLVLTEISEMVESDRKNIVADVGSFESMVKFEQNRKWYHVFMHHWTFPELFRLYIKDSIQDEMADVIIRLLDLAGAMSIDLDAMPDSNYHRDYEKYSFTEHAFALCKGLTKENIPVARRIKYGLKYIEDWANYLGVDIYMYVNMKMQYNETRAIRHGKLY